MENTITNVHLIDCNRVNSDEYLGGEDDNPAVWTNPVSSGLKLNAGDKISVAYSCVNEVGCGEGQIETKGKRLSKSYTYKNGVTTGDLRGTPNFRLDYGPLGAMTTTYTNVDIQKQPKDNEFNVELSYYKNANGENYIHLPRRYDSKIDCSKPVVYDAEGTDDGEGPTGWGEGLETQKKVWTQGDGLTNGRPKRIAPYRVFDDWHWYMGMKRYIPYSEVQKGGMAWSTEGSLALTEGNELTSCSQFWDTNMWKQKNDNSRYTIYMSESQYWSGGSTLEELEADYIITFNENFACRDPALQVFHKYTELKEYEVNKGFNDPNNVAYQLTSQFSDPVLGPQPLKTEQFAYDTTANTGEFIKDVGDYPMPVSMSSRGETYKPFPAGNYVTWARGSESDDAGYTDDTGFGGWACYYNGNDVGSQTGSTDKIKHIKDNDTVLYQSSYNCIGIKRPEFVDAGRYAMFGSVDFSDPNSASTTGFSPKTLGESQSDLDPLSWYEVASDDFYDYYKVRRWMKTAIPWDDDEAVAKKRLGALRDWLKTQKLYPELLDFPKRVSSSLQTHDTSLKVMDTPSVVDDLLTEEQGGPLQSAFSKRFFHMDCYNNDDRGDDDREGQFGDDMVNPGHDYTGADGLAWKEDSTASMPLWFFYDETMEDTWKDNYNPDDRDILNNSDDASDDANEGELCFGFAKRWVNNIDGKSYVAINTRGTTDEQIDRAGNKDGAGPVHWHGNYIGYDFHFNAYGNSAIALYTGIMPNNIDGKQMVGQNLQGGDTAGGWTQNAGPTEALYRNGTLVQPYGFSTSRLIREVYIGAIDPIIQFISANSRFTFGGLHTPEYIQNGNNAGSPLKEETETEAATSVPVEADAGTEVYKINKRVTMWNNYSPELLPWREPASFVAPYWKSGDVRERDQGGDYHFITIGEIRGGLHQIEDAGEPNGYTIFDQSQIADPNAYITAAKLDTNNFGVPEKTTLSGKAEIKTTGQGYMRDIDQQHQYDEMNNNLTPFIVYDSHSGIFLEEFRIDNERDWEKSLFGIMGLSWSQMNPDKIDDVEQVNRQAKLTRVNYNQVKPLTSCALVPQKDLTTCVKNMWQKTMYTTQMPMTAVASLFYGFVADFWVYGEDYPAATWDDGVHAGKRRRYFYLGDVNMPQVYPEVVNPQTSHSIMCDGLPIKMSSPYYLVRSDILADSYYLRDKTPLPIVAVINKENLFGDFAFSQASQLEYTVTQQTTITKIRTEIFDADMSYANVGINSGVIYKVVKQIPTNPDLVQQLLKPDGEAKKGTIDMNSENI